MLTGRTPTQDEITAFDQTLTLYSEHELPNSTFAARVIASTHSDMYGAFTGAISSLKGDLHGERMKLSCTCFSKEKQRKASLR